MTREEYYNLEPMDKLEFLNGELENGKTISQITTELGVGDKVFRRNMEKINYKYSKDVNRYVPMDEVAISVKEPIVKEPKKAITNDFNGLDVKALKELISLIEPIKELIEGKNTINTYTEEESKLIIDKDRFDGDLKTRGIKVYDNVNTKWIEFCKKYDDYKMQDLYSLALLEFIDKYDK